MKLAFLRYDRNKVSQTYITPWGAASQSLIRIVVDIKRVPSTTPLLRRHLGLTVVVRAHGRAAVDDLHNDRVADTANGSTTIPASVGDPVAGSAVPPGACGTLVAADNVLPIASGVVDVGVAEPAGDVGGDVTGCGAVCASRYTCI